MKLYVGSRDYKPAGYKTVDIDISMGADIVADITKLGEVVTPGSCDEIVAGHVLEHIDWPDSMLAITEFQRALKMGGTLKIAIPDMGLMLRMLLNSACSDFYIMGLIYGCGGRTNRFEQHRYGFTAGMLVDILETLGFSDFTWWNSNLPDGSNGWVPQAEGANVAMSLNVSCVKTTEPLVDAKALYDALARSPLTDFMTTAAKLSDERRAGAAEGFPAPRLYQRIHMQLIDARQRIAFLEDRLTEAREAARK
jgi:predicted SAM-dependent methyltransferase